MEGKKETNLLIAGIDAHICDKCIEQAHRGIVLEELKSNGNSKLVGDLILKPKEIREHFGPIRYWSRANQKSDVCSGVQPLQAFDATTIRRQM